MTDDEDSSSEYWTTGSDIGASTTWQFRGRDGLRRLSGPSLIGSDRADDFSAQLTRVQFDHVALEALQADAHRADRTPALIERYPTPLLTFVVLVQGRAELDLPNASSSLGPGDCFVLDSRERFGLVTTAPSRTLRTVVGMEHLPAALLRSGGTPPGPLRRTPLVDSFIAFTSSILSTTAAGKRAEGQQLIQAVSGLLAAVLTEAQVRALTEHGSRDLRHRMERYIDLHFADPDLDPGAVASAFGVSLRKVHGTFSGGDQTIARAIRDRRVAAVAQDLRDGKESVPLAHLARRHGLRGADAAARGFQDRFGMTPTQYRDGGHRTLG